MLKDMADEIKAHTVEVLKEAIKKLEETEKKTK